LWCWIDMQDLASSWIHQCCYRGVMVEKKDKQAEERQDEPRLWRPWRPPRRQMGEAMERLRKNFYQLWRPLEKLRSSDDPGNLLAVWRGAQRPSREWRALRNYEQAIDVLTVSMGRSRGEVEGHVRRYVAERR
jgi:hypothetical protein